MANLHQASGERNDLLCLALNQNIYQYIMLCVCIYIYVYICTYMIISTYMIYIDTILICLLGMLHKQAVWTPSDRQAVACTSFSIFSGLGQIFGFQNLAISARHSSTFFAASASLRCRRLRQIMSLWLQCPFSGFQKLIQRLSSGNTAYSILFPRLKTLQLALKCFFQTEVPNCTMLHDNLSFEPILQWPC